MAGFGSCGKKKSGGGGGDGGGETTTDGNENPTNTTTTTTHKLLMFLSNSKLHSYNIATGTITKISDTQVGGASKMADNSGTNKGASAEGKYYFSASWDGRGAEVWQYDPSKAIDATGYTNPNLLKEINHGTANANPEDFQAYGKYIYFRAQNNVSGYEPFYYDASRLPEFGNPGMLKNIISGSNSSNPDNFHGFGGKVYFRAQATTNKRKLWVFDPAAGPSATNPKQLVDLNNDANEDDRIHQISGANSKLYFFADPSNTGMSLYELDPAAATPTATKLNFDTDTGGNDNLNDIATDGGSYLVFSGNMTGKGNEIFVYNVKEAASGTNPKGYDLNSNGTNSSNPSGTIWIKDSLFAFFATDDGTDKNLWILDASQTMDATNPKKVELSSGTHSASLLGAQVVDGKLYFIGSSQDATIGKFFAVYDPAKTTDALTYIIKNEAEHTGFSDLAPLTYTTTD